MPTDRRVLTPVFSLGHLVDVGGAVVGFADCVVRRVEADILVCGFGVADVLADGCFGGGGEGGDQGGEEEGEEG